MTSHLITLTLTLEISPWLIVRINKYVGSGSKKIRKTIFERKRPKRIRYVYSNKDNYENGMKITSDSISSIFVGFILCFYSQNYHK